MASLTIGGQIHDLRPSAADLGEAEKRIMREGGRPLLAAFLGAQETRGLLAKYELEWVVWAAWRHTQSDERIRGLLAQFYTDGGTLFELHQAVIEALLDSGLVGRRPAANGGPPADPPPAGTSGS